MTRATVIICAHTMDRWAILSRAVAAVAAQTVPAEQVILVVDGNDELLRRAEAELPVDLVLANRRPGGASGGRLTGAEEATAPILVYLDDDAVPEREWLGELLAPFTDPLVLGVGGALIPMWEAEEALWLPPEMYWVIGCTWAGATLDNGRIRSPIAANMAIRADVFTGLGGMAVELGRSGSGTTMSGTAEETELSLRAVAQHPGHYFVFSRTAIAHHLVPSTRTTWQYFKDRCRLEGDAKAILTGAVGTRTGLTEELRYTLFALPKAILRDLLSALRGDPDGVRRAATTIAGFLLTSTAYARTRLRRSLAARRNTPTPA